MKATVNSATPIGSKADYYGHSVTILALYNGFAWVRIDEPINGVHFIPKTVPFFNLTVNQVPISVEDRHDGTGSG